MKICKGITLTCFRIQFDLRYFYHFMVFCAGVGVLVVLVLVVVLVVYCA